MTRPLAPLIGCSLAALLGCGSDVSDGGSGGGGADTTFSTLQVTLFEGTIRGCTTRLSSDQDGSPFGEPAEAIALTAGPPPTTSATNATLLVYRTEDPPQNCPPMAAPTWSGSPGEEVDWSDAPVELGPGTAFTLQADCDECEGENAFEVVVELREL
jgi:hypothetical protein